MEPLRERPDKNFLNLESNRPEEWTLYGVVVRTMSREQCFAVDLPISATQKNRRLWGEYVRREYPDDYKGKGPNVAAFTPDVLTPGTLNKLLRIRWSESWQILNGIYHWIRDGVGESQRGAGAAASAAGASAGTPAPAGRGGHRTRSAWTEGTSRLQRPDPSLLLKLPGEPLTSERLVELVAEREPDIRCTEF